MSPYLSVIFVNRNDNYGGDQETRFNLFLEYYQDAVKAYPDLFEFLICDWNPPADRPLLKDAYDWSALKNVKHIIIPQELHKKLCPTNNRPILDYIGRNTCIRHANAPFMLILNQDIFIPRSILNFLNKRKLKKNSFYRADRVDFNASEIKSLNLDNLENQIRDKVIQKHIRPLDFSLPMSIEVTINNQPYVCTQKASKEKEKKSILDGSYYQHIKKYDRFLDKFSPQSIHVQSYKKYLLHTNASGDFLIASKKAFEKIHGFIETFEFYMHTDSYICVQLFAAGYKQKIFTYPYQIYHNDHSRQDREARPESMTYSDHAKIFASMILGRSSYQLNGEDWGLRNSIF